MLGEVFGYDYQEAKITIEVGDYKVSLEGQLEPPTVTTDRFEENVFGRRKFVESMTYNDIQEVVLKLKPKGKIDVNQWRWSIPIAIPPRIEEDK